MKIVENEEDDDAMKLATRLSEREKKEGNESGSRLGNRLERHIEKMEEETEKEIEIPEDIDSQADFLDVFRQLSDKHPELQDVKVNELKKVISRIGMKHPEEVAETLKKGKYKEEIMENKRKYITH